MNAAQLGAAILKLVTAAEPAPAATKPKGKAKGKSASTAKPKAAGKAKAKGKAAAKPKAAEPLWKITKAFQTRNGMRRKLKAGPVECWLECDDDGDVTQDGLDAVVGIVNAVFRDGPTFDAAMQAIVNA